MLNFVQEPGNLFPPSFNNDNDFPIVDNTLSFRCSKYHMDID